MTRTAGLASRLRGETIVFPEENIMELANEADESSVGPASFMVIDPDGNPILIDQHVA